MLMSARGLSTLGLNCSFVSLGEVLGGFLFETGVGSAVLAELRREGAMLLLEAGGGFALLVCLRYD